MANPQGCNQYKSCTTGAPTRVKRDYQGQVHRDSVAHTLRYQRELSRPGVQNRSPHLEALRARAEYTTPRTPRMRQAHARHVLSVIRMHPGRL